MAGEVPEGWPAVLPHPPGLTLARAEGTGGPYQIVEGRHEADAATVLDWMVAQASDGGWLVLGRDQLGASVRVRLARETARWILVVAAQHDEDGSAFTWVSLRQQRSEPAVFSSPVPADAGICAAGLARTPERPGLACELHLGAPVAPVPSTAEQPDAAGQGGTTALVFSSGVELMLLTVGEGGRTRGPEVVAELEAPRLAEARPQVVPGVSGGWLVSWSAGDPLERRAAHYDSRLRRTDRVLNLSQDLAEPGVTAWAPILRNRQSEYAAAWLERHEGRRVFRVAGVKRDGDRIRRSGRFPARGAEPDAGPELVYGGPGRLGLLWVSADGLMFRAVGTDGLPDESEQRLEPGQPQSFGAVYADESYWVWWDTGSAGFWLRTDTAGCTDDARGSFGGEPQQAWGTADWGPLVQVSAAGEIRLVRLVDEGAGQGSEVEVLGRSPLEIGWSDMTPAADGLAGVVRTDAGYQTARWVCEPQME